MADLTKARFLPRLLVATALDQNGALFALA
jgi:hypothetical protein